MNDFRNVLERDLARVGPAPFDFDDVARRRDRKRRNQRIAAGVVGMAVFVAAIWIVTSVGSLDRSEKSVFPGGDVTGPAVETGPTETGPTEPPPLVEPVLIGTVTRSGAGCALEIVAEPIPAGAGRISVVNETNGRVAFELYRLASQASFAQFEAIAAESKFWGVTVGPLAQGPPAGASLLVQREVGASASGTITDNFTTGDAFAVVCMNPWSGPDYLYPRLFSPAPDYEPFAVVGPIVVP